MEIILKKKIFYYTNEIRDPNTSFLNRPISTIQKNISSYFIIVGLII